MRRLAEALDRVSRTVRALLVVRAAAWIVAAALLAAVAVGLIDLGLRLPALLRGVLLVAGLLALAWAGRRLLLPAWRIRPGRATLAQRLERMDPALRGEIAPAVELLDLADEPGEAGAMARAGVARAGARVASVDAGRIVRWTGVSRGLAALLASAALIASMGAWSPRMVGIGAARVFAPWTDASWPKRFGAGDLTGVEVHPADEALPVRASVGPGDPGVRVRVEWRIGDGPVLRTPMTPQPGADDDARVYERLIDPVGVADAGEVTLRYRVVTPDDQTDWTRVRLVRPPEVESLAATVEPPAHASAAPGLSAFRTGERELGAGDASLGPLLEGSAVRLVWRFSSAVEAVETEAWSDRPLAIGRPDERTLVVSLTPDVPVRIAPVVRDAFGLGVRGSFSAGLDVRPDALPGVAITDPASDEVVTPEAELTLDAEAGDDLGVTALRLEATLLRAPAGSAGAAPEPLGEAVRLAEADLPEPVVRAEVRADLRPVDLGATPGDEITLRAIATDTRGLAGLAVSSERRLRVVAPQDLAARLRDELGPVARLLRRADEQQGALGERLRRSAEEPNALVREQIALADTIAAAARSVRDLDRARERNALDDPALASLLEDLDAVLDEAARAARDAAEDLEARRPEDAARDQEAARDRIGQALSLLDRGEDAFLARRAVARVREQLAEAAAGTAEVGRRTAGQDAASLSPEDRAALEQLAEEQAELADRAREALEELTRRAEALQQEDPAQAEALRRAAEQGRAGAVGELIEQAAGQTGQNQTGQAQQSQQEALEQLDEMLEQIDEAAALRDTALRRRLASLVDSIGRLVAEQAAELDALAAARAGAIAEPAAGMILLRENTLGVIEEASAALAELRLIAESLRAAEGSQALAITALRAAEPAFDDAERQESASLDALTRALEEARRQQQQAEQREQDRRKAELRKAYREALEAQTTLRDESRPLLGRDLTRRERIEARRLAGGQTELAATLEAIRAGTAEISDAPVFALAHERLDGLMRSAAEGLGAPIPPAGVGLDQDQAAAVLASLVAVLGDDAPGPQEDFQDGQGGGGEGGGQDGGEDAGLIPPVAELRLLRDMQQAAMDMTRRLSEDAGLASDQARVARLGDLQRLLAERGVELIERMNQPPTPSEQPPVGPGENDGSREPSPADDGSTGEAP